MTETIGNQLKQAREKQNLKIEDVVQATRILARHIEAIEADNFEIIPSPVQARAFLRIYAEYLGLSLDNLISHQRAEHTLPENLDLGKASQVQTETADNQNSEENAVKSPRGKVFEILEKIQLKIKPIFIRAKSFFLSKIKLPTRKKETISEEPEPTSLPENKHDIPINEKQDETKTWVDKNFPKDENENIQDQHKESQVIFSSIGESLKSRRESLSLNLDEIERHTHVRNRYLVDLEKGNFDDLPSSVQGRGMLQNYAHFLDMDVDAILLKYAEGLQARRVENQPKPEIEENKTPKRFPPKIILPPYLRRYLSPDMVVGTILIITLLVLAIWGTSRIIRLGSVSTPYPTAPSISDILQTPQLSTSYVTIPTSTTESSSNSIPFDITLATTNQAPINGLVQITTIIMDDVWMRVTVDGIVAFEGRVFTGTAYPFGGNTQIEVLTGSGSAIRILYNQSDLGLMGSLGEVVDRIYTPTSILNPTPTITPTITITPVPSATKKSSPTPTPSKTPKYSPTPTP